MPTVVHTETKVTYDNIYNTVAQLITASDIHELSQLHETYTLRITDHKNHIPSCWWNSFMP